jgi:acyl-CoA thioester hydrolase
MSDAGTPVDPRLRGSYRTFSRLEIRFGDQDALGHVNNTVIGSYFEHARCEHLMPRLVTPEMPQLNIVLARIVIDYVRELKYPGAVDIGLRIAKTGGRSFVIGSAIFGGDVCYATAEATIVFFDTLTRRSAEPPAQVRAAIETLK